MKKIIPFIFLTILIFGCIGQKMRYPYKHLDANAFPSDIKKDGYILLVHNQETSRMVSSIQNRRVDKLMKRNYDKPYEMVSSADVSSNSKYADKNVYRYLLKQSEVLGESSYSGGPGMGSQNFTYRTVFFIDRLLEKTYPATGKALSSYEAHMMTLAPYLGQMK